MDVSAMLAELAKVSPYAVLTVLGFYMFFHMYKNSIKEIKETCLKTNEEIRTAYEMAFDKGSVLLKEKSKK